MASFLSVVLVILILAIVFKLYIKLSVKRNGSYVCLTGKTAVITGANSGLGYITALDFAKRGARVILGCRNGDKAEEAVKKIIAATNNKNIVYKLVDCASLKSVRNFAQDIIENEARLDILVNNAGISSDEEGLTPDGIQTILQVNHISGFLLTHLLIDKLKKSTPSRIIMVASPTARFANLNLNTLRDLNTATLSRRFYAMYYNSKLCNIAFAIEMAKRLDGSGVTINAVHPGVATTEIVRDAKLWVKFGFNTFTSLFLYTAEEGAQTQIYASVANEIVNINGDFFGNCNRIEVYKTAKDPEFLRKLWEKSEELAKLSDGEKIPLLV
ncbi:phosphatidylinositol-glycan biosynthesis class f protein-related [Holotrichia oblita]|uniref:Phosphatidylinositol-glycan biosynthesis class f protein-related n=1 Tax=Holotrichia oblita TaxID=644536 RepID=A0ACB9T6C1_HOLOL|nr:phosphatidylinositol-glycan biosynthesis class f protein-related [Holotrichia oblita]